MNAVGRELEIYDRHAMVKDEEGVLMRLRQWERDGQLYKEIQSTVQAPK